jgi:hypothetical protein
MVRILPSTFLLSQITCLEERVDSRFSRSDFEAFIPTALRSDLENKGVHGSVIVLLFYIPLLILT